MGWDRGFSLANEQIYVYLYNKGFIRESLPLALVPKLSAKEEREEKNRN